MNSPSDTSHSSLRILIVEDSPRDAELIVHEIGRGGFKIAWKRVQTEAEMKAALDAESWDAVISDYRLPQFDGLAALRLVQGTKLDIPFIIVSGTIGEDIAVAAMKAGAHDYLMKDKLTRLAPALDRELREAKVRRDRAQAEEALRNTERRFSVVFHTSPLAIALARRRDGAIVEVNKAWQELTGFDSAEVRGRTTLELNVWVHPEDRAQMVNVLLKGGTVRGTDIQMRHKSGAILDVSMSAETIELDGEPCLLTMAQDITERRRTEQALQEALARFETVIESAPQVAVEGFGRDGTVRHWNKAAERIYGYAAEEAIGRRIQDLLHEDDAGGCQNAIRDVWDSGKPCPAGEWQVLTKPGGKRWVYSSMFPVFEKGVVSAVYCMDVDITDRKAAEERIRESERALKRAQQVGHVGNWDWDVSAGKLVWSEELYRIWGVGQGFDLSYDSIQAMIHPDDRALNDRKVRDILDGDGESSFEFRIIRPDGSVRLLCQSIEVSRDDAGRAVRAFGIMQDITDRRQAEEALRQSEVRFRELFENMSSGVAVYEAVDDGRDFVFKDFNAAGERIEQISRDRVIGRRVTEVFPGVEDMGLLDVLRRVWKTGVAEGHPVSHYRDGRIAGWRENRLFRLPSGEIVSVYDDVTERKQAEEALRESETRYRSLFENSVMAISQASPDGRLLQANQAYANLYGYATPEEMMADVNDIGRQLYADPQDREEVLGILARDDAMEPREVRVVRRDGTEMWLLASARVIRAADGSVLCYQAEHVDITARKRAEEALRASREVLQAVLNAIPVRVFWKDRDLRYLGCNAPFARDAGFEKPEDLLGKDDYAMGWKDQAELYRGDDRVVIESGESKLLFEEPQTTRSGETAHLLTSKVPLRNAEGAVVGVLGAYMDITDRKLAAARLKEQLDELQRWHEATLGREERVLELKREVNELLAEAGLARKYESAEQDRGGKS